MNDGRIKGGKSSEVALIAGATDELITKFSLDLDNDIVLKTPALLKVKSTVTTGNIKVTLAGENKTVITLAHSEVNEANVHVVKIFKTGTTCLIGDFYLWQ
jgi:hypothetical protein